MRDVVRKHLSKKPAWTLVAAAAGIVSGIAAERAVHAAEGSGKDLERSVEFHAHFERRETGSLEAFADFDIEVEPLAIMKGDGGSHLELAIEGTSRFAKAAAFSVGYHVVDAKGNAITKPQTPAPLLVSVGGRAGISVVTPRGLTDGAYFVSVVVAATDGERETVLHDRSFFRVEGEDIILMEAMDWYRLPEASEAPSESGRPQ